MSTDLFDDPELDADGSDLAWDDFLPDPPEPDEEDVGLDAEDAWLDADDVEPETDDSDFDWDAVLDDDSGLDAEEATEATARVEAAFARIVDSVRRSLEPESEESGPEPDPETEELDAELAAEAELALTDPEPEAELELEPVAEVELDTELEAEAELVAELEAEAELDAEPQLQPEAEREAEAELEPEAELDAEPQLQPETELEPVAELEPEAELEPASSRSTRHAHRRRAGSEGRRSPVFVATVVLACIFLLLVGGLGIARQLHHTTTVTARPPARSTVVASPSPEAAQVRSATDEATSATTAALAGLAALASFPTPPNVATVINPYISSLQLYEAFMSRTSVPEPALSAAHAAEAQTRQDATFLTAIDGLPPISLGAFLQEFASDATQLQATLSKLEQDLPTPATP